MSDEYKEIVDYMGMHKLPTGFVEAYELYKPTKEDLDRPLIERSYYEALLAPHNIPQDKKQYLDETLEAIEKDEKVLFFSKFLVWDMCSMRNKYDIDNYTELVPSCLGKYNEGYGFIILLACVPVSEQDMIRRGIPKSYYEDIPHRMIREQLDRYYRTGTPLVFDMPWKLNFYTLSIFLLDRFLFIPYEHGESFHMYRSKKTGKVFALNETGCKYDAEGQLLNWADGEWDFTPKGEVSADKLGTGYEYAARKAVGDETFTTVLTETDTAFSGQYMNPCGFTENRIVTLDKNEYEEVLKPGDYMIALHIPGGEGYTPERMRNSCRLALDFFGKYYPELDMKGFWSSSWLYDKRLQLLIGKGKNITNCQDIMFRYSDGEDGEMAYIHLYHEQEQKLAEAKIETSLQAKAKEFLENGNRFRTTGMMILKEEILSENVYQTAEDEKAFDEMARKWRM